MAAVIDVVALIIAVLAVWEIVEILHHSSLFSSWRARVELWEGKIGQLLRCPFCLSPWVSLVVVLLLCLGETLQACGPRLLGLAIQAPLYALAIARAANLANDRWHRYSRTPRSNALELPPGDEPGKAISNTDLEND